MSLPKMHHFWHVSYFEPKAIKAQNTQEKLFNIPHPTLNCLK